MTTYESIAPPAAGQSLSTAANLGSGPSLAARYEAAKAALAACDRIDECKDWINKHAALAQYAKQPRTLNS